MNERRAPFPLSLYYFSLIVLLYLPIGILLLFSLNSNTTLTFPLRGLTFDWYRNLLTSDAVLRSARNSLIVASGSSLVATVLGTMVSLLLTRFQFKGKNLLLMLSALPLIVPYIVLGVALLLLFSALHIERSLFTVTIAHTVVALPYTLLIISSRLSGFDTSMEEAAMDLGADYPTTLRRVVLPMIFPAMVSAWLTAFTVSFDEFALALFLSGTQPTFPVYLFSQLRFANRLPLMIALAVLLMIGTLTLVFIAEKYRQKES
ncbi:MAG TPA: ABC transporter permease [Anaerolineales bacterium]|nr:ABC transporter permease [Anaerolineales bacterium]HMX76465.1 ABC transporter permease [Anaerolineales bacterium]HMZ45118.1 ABC transporter permease [Anaerolineales bacterium]HNA56416.1 ABC transporter permease [Anaerolineales bacterium]HNB88691.1 ABC transporter permease [Anaerolineales bacterium]